MAIKNKRKRRKFWSDLFEFFIGVVLGIVILFGVWKAAVTFCNEPLKSELLTIEDGVKSGCESLIEKTKNMLNLSDDEKFEVEGAKLSDIASYKMCNYVDFTIPYTWTVGEIEVDDAATEEAIAVAGDNVVMTVSLRNIEMEMDSESLKWEREAMIFELKNMYPDYNFTKLDLFEGKAAVISVDNMENHTKMYIVIIPLEEKTILVSYSFEGDDWLADLYFNTAISEMIESI